MEGGEAVDTYGNNRVLIVDDQPEIHDDFSEMLKSGWAHALTNDLAADFISEPRAAFLPQLELFHATDGEKACGIIRGARASKRPIAVAFIDIRMPPGIDGVETTRRIREVDGDVEVVLMTAYTDKSLSEIVYGMEALHKLLYIRKPFSREEIQQVTLSLVGKWNVEQALAEQQRLLTASHQRLEAVLDATGDAMAMYDTGGHLVFANKGYEDLCGLTESELKALSPEALTARFQGCFQEPVPPLADGLFVDNQAHLVQQVTAGRYRGQRLFHRAATPVHDSRQDVMGRLFVYRDVSKEIEFEQLKVEVLRLRSELETTAFAGIVGDSPKMRQMYTLIHQALKSNTTVLIQGESGTGKELVARSFHYNGPRKEKPFLAVNCSAVPEALIESELFGHEQGAFTGAAGQRIGLFERATGGTVFLDEVGDMPLTLQAKLLRVLQEREVQRVGGRNPVPVDVRVIAATNKNLQAAVRAGTFREDLFYRLAVFPVAVPPLRERREDIPVLANFFLKKHSERLDKRVDGFSPTAVRAMLQYDWPGNVREMENAIERAVLLETTAVLHVSSLPPEVSPLASSGGDASTPATARLRMSEVEREAIAQALDASHHNVAAAARLLGINRATLYRKLKKYDLPDKP